jgi:hypothetical protein
MGTESRAPAMGPTTKILQQVGQADGAGGRANRWVSEVALHAHQRINPSEQQTQPQTQAEPASWAADATLQALAAASAPHQ